jgi:hypothetical protein
MIRNEEHYVQEWLTFHRVIGVEQFVIVLHKCDDKTEERIRALPFADTIRLHKVVSDTQHAQMSAFAWMAQQYGTTTEWMLFCDGDEYVFGAERDDFREILADYESFGGLFVNWMEYGHSHLLKRPQTLCIETYLKRAPAESWWHTSGKSIVKPKELLRPFAPSSVSAPLGYSFLSPHLFKTQAPTVHTDYTPVSYTHWWRSEHCRHDVARCHHYRFRSLEDWQRRTGRGNSNDAYEVCCATKPEHKTEEEWENGGNWQIFDDAAVRFAGKVREQW